MILPSEPRDSVRVGVCVLNWNVGKALTECVQLLLAAAASVRNLHLVVVDNCSSDRSVEQLRSTVPSVELIVNPVNLGYSAGNNVGANRLLNRGCDVLVFVNPDVRVTDSTVPVLVDALLQERETGSAGGMARSAPGEFSAPGRTRPTFFQKLVAYGPLRRFPLFRHLHDRHCVQVDGLAAVYAVCGACVAFRSEAFRDVGGFDERSFLYEEELIMAERLKRRGWRTVTAAEAVYDHINGLSTRQILYRRNLHFIRSEYLLVRHYFGWNLVLCCGLRFYRYCEWIGLCLYWLLSRKGRGAGDPAASFTGAVTDQ